VPFAGEDPGLFQPKVLIDLRHQAGWPFRCRAARQGATGGPYRRGTAPSHRPEPCGSWRSFPSKQGFDGCADSGAMGEQSVAAARFVEFGPCTARHLRSSADPSASGAIPSVRSEGCGEPSFARRDRVPPAGDADARLCHEALNVPAFNSGRGRCRGSGPRPIRRPPAVVPRRHRSEVVSRRRAR